jgi:RES domain-containing protein
MQGAYLHGGRYNIQRYFGVLYTSLDLDTARREFDRYGAIPLKDGLMEASIELELTHVLDLTDSRVLSLLRVNAHQLVGDSYVVPQEIARQCWEVGIEGLIVPSAAVTGARNLALFMDNQRPGWHIRLAANRSATQ